MEFLTVNTSIHCVCFWVTVLFRSFIQCMYSVYTLIYDIGVVDIWIIDIPLHMCRKVLYYYSHLEGPINYYFKHFHIIL